MSLRIGHHRNNLHLTLASLWPEAFDVDGAVFVPYKEGRDTASLLAESVIDIGGTGSTPPIIAANDGRAVEYIAASAPRPANGAVLVGASSSLHEIGHLKGRKIALLDGSFHTYLLARLLEARGLSLRDVERIELSPSDSEQALRDGGVDAWIAMAPHLEIVKSDPTIRVLADGEGAIPNRSLFWTLRDRQFSDSKLAVIVAGLQRLAQTIALRPQHAGQLLAATFTELDVSGWTRIVRERDWTIIPANADILAEQETETSTLRRHGELATIRPNGAP